MNVFKYFATLILVIGMIVLDIFCLLEVSHSIGHDSHFLGSVLWLLIALYLTKKAYRLHSKFVLDDKSTNENKSSNKKKMSDFPFERILERMV